MTIQTGKKIFVTTPYRGCIYEPHTGLFFLHWLPLRIFRRICNLIGKSFWSSPTNFNPLYAKDVFRLIPDHKLKVIVFKMFGFLKKGPRLGIEITPSAVRVINLSAGSNPVLLSASAADLPDGVLSPAYASLNIQEH